MGSFLENVNDQLVTLSQRFLSHKYFGNYTAGVNGVYFDNEHVFVASSNMPYSVVGPFSKGSDKILGSELVEDFTDEPGGDILLIDERNSREPGAWLIRSPDGDGCSRAAAWPSGKAEDCKSFIPSSNLGAAFQSSSQLSLRAHAGNVA